MNKNESDTPEVKTHEVKTQEAPRSPRVIPPPSSQKLHRDRRGRRLLMAGVILLLLTLVSGAALENRQLWDRFLPDNRQIADRPTIESDGNNNVTQQETDIAELVAKVSPSVVSITTQSQARSYFGVRQQEGAGTGIVVSSDGYVLTNKHVVDGASTVVVVLSDGTRHDDVRVVGSDPLNDVAFLKIPDVDNLKPAELGNSSSIRVGQRVVAIGNSLGQYQNTVTSGIISGTGRPVVAQSRTTVESLTDLLQTDAAINPGNSGGPLLNMAGQVIGMNTAVATDAQGIGFAIPVNGIKGMLRGVLQSGEVQRAFLGVNHIPVTPESAQQYDLPVQNGAYIYVERGSAVANGSPADRAGVRDGDIITKVNDVSIGSNGALTTLIGEYVPGDNITLTLVRGGNERTVTATLTSYED